MAHDIEYNIFISYRHGESDYAAGWLNESLKNMYNVSFDAETIHKGELPDILYKRIKGCVDFIIIVARDTFERTLDPSDGREDWVRLEIAYALECKKNIVPILINGTTWPQNLPDDIKAITKKLGPDYSVSYHDSFIKTLMNDYLESKRLETLKAGVSGTEFLKRPEIHYEHVCDLVPEIKEIPLDYIGIAQLEISVKYEGYIKREMSVANSFAKFENYEIPDGLDYLHMHGLALEARQKLDKIRPRTVGQAGRISGINPADISILILNLKRLGK